MEGSGCPLADMEHTGSPTTPLAAILWAASTAVREVYHSVVAPVALAGGVVEVVGTEVVGVDFGIAVGTGTAGVPVFGVDGATGFGETGEVVGVTDTGLFVGFGL